MLSVDKCVSTFHDTLSVDKCVSILNLGHRKISNRSEIWGLSGKVPRGGKQQNSAALRNNSADISFYK